MSLVFVGVIVALSLPRRLHVAGIARGRHEAARLAGRGAVAVAVLQMFRDRAGALLLDLLHGFEVRPGAVGFGRGGEIQGCIYPLVEATLYLATAPKSNSAGAYFKAMQKIEQEGAGSVPKHLQDGNRDGTPTGQPGGLVPPARNPGDMKSPGQGQGYDYPHEHEGHFIPQQYLPKKLLGTYFYQPSEEGYEAQVTSRLAAWREAQRKALGIEKTIDMPDLPEEKIKELKRNIK